MHNTIAILGRQQGLGIAELESLLGSDGVMPFGKHACLFDKPDSLSFRRIGGSVRFASVIAESTATNWATIEKNLLSEFQAFVPAVDGKLSFGISVFGVKTNKQKVAKTAINLKKKIRDSGQSVRMVPHNNLELNAATVLYNKLTHENGIELLIVSDGSKTIIAKTTDIQDIDAYADRDRNRPNRDAKVGMLPPKLAQVITNLAVGSNYDERHRLLDAFCGTGVMLQEAMLMGYDVYGTDLVPRMIDYSEKNLKWLESRGFKLTNIELEVGDAAKHSWKDAEAISVVAGETYLGQPLSTLPNSEHLSKIMHEVNSLHHKFIENIGTQIASGTPLCLAVPTWRGKKEFLHLSALDYLDNLGYTRKKFKHVRNDELIYWREGQVVGRELLVLEKS